MVGWDRHKKVLDERGFSAYRVHVDWGLNFLSVFVTGSHKAAFSAPPETLRRDSWLWEDNECPAVSVLLSTEAITHTGTRWSNPSTDRVAVFNCVDAKWHSWEPHPEQLAAMHALRRSLFRPVPADKARLSEPWSG